MLNNVNSHTKDEILNLIAPNTQDSVIKISKRKCNITHINKEIKWLFVKQLFMFYFPILNFYFY